MHRLVAAVAALCVGPLATGCGGESRAADSADVLLQPLAARGPDPFTASTASAPAPFAPPPVAPAPKSPAGGGTSLRTMLGSTPGLYGGVQETASCDVEALVRHLGADGADGADKNKNKNKNKVRAFAEGAGIDQEDIAPFLRGLTPVVLRADTRITGYGFRDGEAAAFQAVLQAGTAVLVDEYGAPRVRCAGGNPLKPPMAVKRPVVIEGAAWSGHRSDRVVVIKPATQVVNNLVIVNIADSTWIERPTGTDGEEDARPAVLPPVDPDEVFSDLTRTESSGAMQGDASVPATGPDGPPAPQPPPQQAPAPQAPAPQPDQPQPDQPLPDQPLPDQPLPDDPGAVPPADFPYEPPQDEVEPLPADPPVPDLEPQAPVDPDPVPPAAAAGGPDGFQG
ncbi:hypothetical protein J7E88_33925 [Streptomyces sp. ISL-10]|uniref:DUF6777 domain-containing protein n=1 Tax=Streptomyces sp. ISL-10 TaxID=2819172 RepID=UPI001BEC5F69|nr:DUF6777 domain-containing protein [Streptomyces sp. ISL-10]MBT2370137.1 hypothetical protein [Streptomyces sp. ISL-10]